MKSKFWIVLTITYIIFYFTGCVSDGGAIHAPYSFIEDDSAAAILAMGQGIRLVDFEGNKLQEGTHWTSFRLPAGRPMNLRVYIIWGADLAGERRRGIFKCPPLEAGKEYRVRFNVKTSGIFINIPMDGYSIVLERKREGLAILRQYEQVYSQVIPPLPRTEKKQKR